MAGIHHLVKQMTLLRNVVIFFSGLAVNNLQSEKAASKAALTVITFLTGLPQVNSRGTVLPVCFFQSILLIWGMLLNAKFILGWPQLKLDYASIQGSSSELNQWVPNAATQPQ